MRSDEMLSDNKPIIFNTPMEFDEIEIYLVHDLHYGSELHDRKKWERFKRLVMSKDNAYIIFAGDYCENVVVGSKGDIYTQTAPPFVQKEWFTEQLCDVASKTICIVPGNHEDNRITKTCGLYPVFESAVRAGIPERYRQCYAFVDIGVGHGGHGKQKQNRYVGYVTHRLKDCKAYNGSDFVDGIDFALYGHDHAPKDQPRSKLVYDAKNKCVYQKDIEVVNSGSFTTFGGYAPRSGCRPQASKCYMVMLSGKKNKKDIKTLGFRV
jgi:predicted phosphodiesterase